MFYELVYKFFGFSFWKKEREEELIARLNRSGVRGIVISKNHSVAIPVDILKESPKIKKLKAQISLRFKDL